MMADKDLLFFALGSSSALGDEVARGLGMARAAHEERTFEDGEFKIRPLVNVRGRDVVVLHSLFGDDTMTAADKLARLLFFVGALKDAAAARVTVIAPYLCFLRKDQQTKPRDPVTTRYLAALIESVGTDAVMTIEAHNVAAFQNAFRCDTDHLDLREGFADQALAMAGDAPLAVVSPDPGGMKRAELFRERLKAKAGREVSKGFMDKHRSGGVLTGEMFIGDVAGRCAVIIDDMISTGSTIVRAAEKCRAEGARQVLAFATHGLFSGGAPVLFQSKAVDRIVVSDSVPPFRAPADLQPDRLSVVPIAPLLAEAIRRSHEGGSIADLLDGRR
jgi:ribose-phosphate pyrophosphokinase